MRVNPPRLITATLAISWGLLVLGEAPAAQQREEELQPGTLSLRDVVELAQERSPLLRAGRADVRKAELRLHDVRARAYFPDLSLQMQAGAVPGAQGDIFWSPDEADELDDLGPFVKIDASLIQPLYTFGKASSATGAAAGGVKVAESSLEVSLQVLSEKVIQAYWAVISADAGTSLAEDLQDRYDELISRVEDELLNPYSIIDDTHLMEARTHAYEVERAYQDSFEERTLAERRLALLLDFDLGRKLLIEDVTTPEFGLGDGHLDQLVDQALSRNPGMTKVRNAVDALDAQVDLARANRFPDLYLAGGFRYGHAGNRTDQTNPFAVDNFNYRSIGLFIGVRWDLNFIRRQFEIGMRTAERNAAVERQSALSRQVTFEVVEAYSKARRGARLLESAQTSLDAAESWLRLSLDNWDLGIGEIDRVFRAYEAFYRLERAAIEQEFEFNASLARLAAVLGDVELYLTWVENGIVALQ